MRITLVHALLGGVALAMAACGRTPLHLDHTFHSADALACAVLDALASRDRAALEHLALSEREFRVFVWPRLPASRPERNVPVDYVWRDLRQKSEAHLAQTLSVHGGLRYTLRHVRFAGETSRYATFHVARRPTLIVSDSKGREQQLRVFGSVVFDGTRYKLFSYVVD